MTRKTYFFEGCSWFKFNNLKLALGMALKFNTSVAKELKVKVRKFLGLIFTLVEVAWGKLVGGFLPSWIWLRWNEPRRQELTNFSSKMFKIMIFLRSPKCSKTIVELMFATQKANACSLLDWFFCSVVPFLGNFGLKTQNCQFKLKFGT